MEKRTEGEPQQNQKTKKFNSTLWIRVISIVLSVSMVAIASLGASLFISNNKLALLRTDLVDTQKKFEALNAENIATESEIEAIKNDLTLTNEELDAFVAELALVKDALAKSMEKQESLENSLKDLKNSNQSAQNEIDQLKSDIANANSEISGLKQQLKESNDKIRIYIDQGHNPTSYHNSGASGNGLYEQDITFLVGCILADVLRADGRFEVQLSRPNKSIVLGTDSKSSLKARVDGAAAFEADYLISLHTNYFEQDTASGIEIYVADKTGESYVLAESLLNEMVDSTNLRKREVKLEPRLDILEFSTMPAVLVEMGFISNSTDAALMSEHPELFATGIYNGILDYFGFLSNTPDAT
jgi:N-acetylmuramoyl-L-alanine amidase